MGWTPLVADAVVVVVSVVFVVAVGPDDMIITTISQCSFYDIAFTTLARSVNL